MSIPSDVIKQLYRDFDESEAVNVVWESMRFSMSEALQSLHALQTYNVVGLSPTDIFKSIASTDTATDMMMILLSIEKYFPELNRCDQVLLCHADIVLVRFVFPPTGRRGRIAGRIAQLDTAVLEQTMSLRRGSAYNDPRRKYMCDSCGIKHQDHPNHPNIPLSDVFIGLGLIVLYCIIMQLAINFIIQLY